MFSWLNDSFIWILTKKLFAKIGLWKKLNLYKRWYSIFKKKFLFKTTNQNIYKNVEHLFMVFKQLFDVYIMQRYDIIVKNDVKREKFLIKL